MAGRPQEGATQGVITVGFDGSARAAQAVRWAATEAARRHAEVRIVACFGAARPLDPWSAPAADHDDMLRQSALEVLHAQIACVEARHLDVRFVAAAVPGPAPDALLDVAIGSELLVIGATGHGFLDAWRVGAVAHEALRRAPCPLVVVPATLEAQDHGRILVGVDGSPGSDDAIRWASDEATRREADLLLAHAWTGPPTTTPNVAHDVANVDAALVLEAALRVARAHGCGRVDGVLVEGAPSARLVQLALHADLVVVGAVGQHPGRAMLFGSLGHAVSARATCPTVVVRTATT